MRTRGGAYGGADSPRPVRPIGIEETAAAGKVGVVPVLRVALAVGLCLLIGLRLELGRLRRSVSVKGLQACSFVIFSWDYCSFAIFSWELGSQLVECAPQGWWNAVRAAGCAPSGKRDAVRDGGECNVAYPAQKVLHGVGIVLSLAPALLVLVVGVQAARGVIQICVPAPPSAAALRPRQLRARGWAL